jgi:ubiquinone/menaquinone biosynthesis C-methylase UbiE
MIRRCVPLAGRQVLEVGCGAGALLGWLVREGATPVGLDPNLGQLDRAKPAAPGVALVAGVGEALPFASGRFDLVLFFNSLHHVPLAEQWQALAEASRVLRARGKLLVVEPLAQGPWFDLLQAVEDETEVRQEARRALTAGATLGLVMEREEVYDTRIVEASWSTVRERFLAANPVRASRLGELEPQLEQRFATTGEAVDQGRAFSQPMRLNLLRRQP